MLNMNCGARPMANMSSVTGMIAIFSIGKRSGKALQLSASGPLQSACIARTKTIAVTSRPITAMAVKDAVMANEPLKIRNSPTKPFSPGKPNDENMATLIQPQRIGVRCINPPKSSMPRWQWSEYNRADCERQQPGSDDFDFVWKKRKQQAHETVNAHFRKDAGQNHRHAGRGAFIGVGQPGVKWEERHFDRESKENSPKSEPGEFTREQSVFTKCSKRGKIERSPSQINSEESEQHRHASQKRVEEKLRRGAVAILPSPDFDEQERGNQTHLVKQKPENKILRRERAVQRRLHNQHQRVKPAVHPLRKKREGNDERGK